MSIAIDPAWVLAVFYTAVRLGVLLIMSPILSSLSGVVTVRVLLTLSLSVLLVNGLGTRPPAHELALGPVVLGAMLELGVGVTLAFGVFAAFGAFSLAGKILDIQSGFGMGTVYDPVTRGGAPLFGTMLNMLAVVLFFGLEGHHAFLRGVAYSLQQVPPGAGLDGLALEPVLRQFGLMFSLGVSLVIPVILCLLLAETALAIVSRVLPQMNVFVIGVPVKIVVALAVLALTVGTMGSAMGRVYNAIFTYWEQVLG
ncbi:flagellar biosynthetic protein FliR [Pseudoduganella namucuonensis]|uniref:Flagellar biosynthetic protein FliR n=1 Tax=Pseudoduganella namucuonensis TaxID=1035707 RepID=A0A1I7M3V6_9BURK|nr:flagellar biosynthetic protein FliR [Pseudoduganella namucuonensis]SFV16618.1 flagellar biosynthetic protein FliR [Pseudoduganella namucuonensis]